MKLLLCLYACENDQSFLEDLLRTPLMQGIRNDQRFQILKVYADSRLERSKLKGDTLVVNCPESYTSLSRKTYLMVANALQLEFDFLLKLDSTIVRYVEKPQKKTSEMLAKLTPGAVQTALAQADFFESDYSGLVRQRASERGFEAWMQMKGIACAYRNVFSHVESTPEYFLGKFYSLSRNFCRFIAENGSAIALEHERHLGGSEDVMIGRLYQQWIK